MKYGQRSSLEQSVVERSSLEQTVLVLCVHSLESRPIKISRVLRLVCA